MMMALDTIYNVNIHDRLLVRMGSNLCYWEVSQVEKLSPGPKPICLIMFFALLHTLKDWLGWPRKSFSYPAAHVPVLPSTGCVENPASLLSTQRHSWPGPGNGRYRDWCRRLLTDTRWWPASHNKHTYSQTDGEWEGCRRSKIRGSLPNGMAQREIGEVSINVPHTRKSLVKGERFIRECMKDLS